ncbi:Adenosine receptor A1 [Bulinus truncatus]|nr:Adenosine receptor A1 [Bulinus truncatus]
MWSGYCFTSRYFAVNRHTTSTALSQTTSKTLRQTTSTTLRQTSTAFRQTTRTALRQTTSTALRQTTSTSLRQQVHHSDRQQVVNLMTSRALHRELDMVSTEVLVGVLSVFGNVVVVLAIWKNRRLHTITNVFVGNLAIADIVVGLLAAPCAALAYAGLPHNFYGCVFINSVILIVTNISILMLLGVALERFLAIKEPFLYQRTLTVRRAVYINLCIWLFGFLLGMVPMYGWNKGAHELDQCQFTFVITYEYMVYFQFFGLVLLPLFLMMCIYIYILIIVRRHMRQTNALRNMFQQDRRVQEGFSKDVKAAKMLALVILFFGIFWLPVNILNCVTLFCPTCIFPYELLLVAIVMSHANSCINPFLYAASNSRIKRAIKGIVGIKILPEELSSDQNHQRQTNGVSQACAPTPNQISERSDHEDNRVLPFTISQDKFLQLNQRLLGADTPVGEGEQYLEIPPLTLPDDLDKTRSTLASTVDTRSTGGQDVDDGQSVPTTSHQPTPETRHPSRHSPPHSRVILNIAQFDPHNNKLHGSNGLVTHTNELKNNEMNHLFSRAISQDKEIFALFEDSRRASQKGALTPTDGHIGNQWCWPADQVKTSTSNVQTESPGESPLGSETNHSSERNSIKTNGSPSPCFVPSQSAVKSSGEDPRGDLLELKYTNGYLDTGQLDPDRKITNYQFILEMDDGRLFENDRTEQTKL